MKNRLIIILTVFFITLAILVAISFNAVVKEEEQVFFIFFILVIILFICSVRLFNWLKTGVMEPLMKLSDAIKEVASGNLDHILDRDSDDEIGNVSQEFENLRIRLKENMESRQKLDRENRELIGNISHDLKTPITAIKGYAEGILDGVVSTPQQQEKYITTIYNKADDMAKLIDELTYYTVIFDFKLYEISVIS